MIFTCKYSTDALFRLRPRGFFLTRTRAEARSTIQRASTRRDFIPWHKVYLNPNPVPGPALFPSNWNGPKIQLTSLTLQVYLSDSVFENDLPMKQGFVRIRPPASENIADTIWRAVSGTTTVTPQ
ncbi:Hypothetical_protein [Hexamita inflata]|uniref:Hypothetical_protein n=1 Tax=Hexamita inflata TaxID=28002 RepID=A0AA86Q260_9EUKA|nr:Hypothetical protein HINF_LOCUS35937 [Hexamita inflata]